MTSTCRVQSPHTLTRIFLTDYLPIPDMIYVNTTHFLYAKNPSKLKTDLEGLSFLAWQSSPPNTVFFIWRASPCLWHYLEMCLSPIFSFLCLSLSASILGKTLPHATPTALFPQILPVLFSTILSPVHQGGLSARP